MSYIPSVHGRPYDAVIEYIESTGTQWIDTGIVADSSTYISVVFSDYTVAGRWLFGARKAYHNSALGMYTSAGGAVNRWYRCRGGLDTGPFTFTTVSVGLCMVTYDGATFIAERGDPVPFRMEATDSTQAFSSSPYTIVICGLNNGGNVLSFASAKIYRVVINDERDMIPVRFTNEYGESEGALYDLVSETLFMNMGTGSFIMGGDVEEGE